MCYSPNDGLATAAAAAASGNFRASECSCIVNTIIQMYGLHVIQAMYCTCYEHAISPL